jgi:16S rRNA (uracil1498-N3)-methyltransferase
MTRRRFYAPPVEIRDSIIALSAEETHHLTHVLRMAPGDPAFVFDGCGREYRCNFRGVKDDRAQLEVGEMLSDVVESPVEITLAQALAKGEKFDFIVQKVTELGVSRIVPLVTRYADARLDDQQTARRIERWRRISLEAVKQCGRRKLVEITVPRTVREFAGAGGVDSASQQTLLLFSERGGVAITDALAEKSNPHAVVAMVGPEGGWSDDELVLLNEAGSKAVTLGPRVLRTETAAIVALTLIQHAIGDLSTGGTE